MGVRELKTEDKLEYQFFELPGSLLKFQVKTNNDAHLAFTQAPGEGEPMYEVFIGGWENGKTAIRKNKQKPDAAIVDTPGILTSAGFKGFWISIIDGTIAVGYDGESNPFICFKDPEPFPVYYYGVCTGWGATGEWYIEETKSDAAPEAASQVKRAPTWVPASAGVVPEEGFIGGQDVSGEILYVARAFHEGANLPGKLVPSHQSAYVAWSGAEHAKPEYEVLCNASDAHWVPAVGGVIPENAFPGGNSEDGETLFIGRATHEGSVTIGKVQASHNVCYIPFDGVEVPKEEYEVLVL